jgi:alginate O-acetyltransferase complex protein AlgI
MITMVLGGLWHGAAWSYAVWGAFHGGALALERFATPYLRLGDGRVVRTMRTLGVFLCVTLAWLLFKISDASHVLLYLRSIGTNLWMPDKVGPITSILIYSSPVLLYHMAYLLREKGRLHLTPWRESICYGAMLFLLITNSGSAGAFIYFQF